MEAIRQIRTKWDELMKPERAARRGWTASRLADTYTKVILIDNQPHTMKIYRANRLHSSEQYVEFTVWMKDYPLCGTQYRLTSSNLRGLVLGIPSSNTALLQICAAELKALAQ